MVERAWSEDGEEAIAKALETFCLGGDGYGGGYGGDGDGDGEMTPQHHDRLLRRAAAECLISSEEAARLNGSEILRAMFDRRLHEYHRQQEAEEGRKTALSEAQSEQQEKLVKGAKGRNQGKIEKKGVEEEPVPGIQMFSANNVEGTGQRGGEGEGGAGDVFAPQGPDLTIFSRSPSRHQRSLSEDEDGLLLLSSTPDLYSFHTQVFVSPIKHQGRPEQRLHFSDDEEGFKYGAEIIPSELKPPSAAASSMDASDLLRLTASKHLILASGAKGEGFGHEFGGGMPALRAIHTSSSKHQGLVRYSEEIDPLRADHQGSHPGIYTFDRTSNSTTKLQCDRVQKSGISFKPEHLSPVHSPSAEHALRYRSDAPYVPWIPKGGLQLMVSDKEDVLFGWEERKEIGLLAEGGGCSQRCVLKRSGIVKESFENYVRQVRSSGSSNSSTQQAYERQGLTTAGGKSSHSSRDEDRANQAASRGPQRAATSQSRRR